MNTPFVQRHELHQRASSRDKQAQSVADVLQNDPSVRVARGFGKPSRSSYSSAATSRGSDDIAYNGLYSLLPRQYIATELFERVEVLPRRHRLPERR